MTDVPRNPGAWLMAVAKRRAIDLLRRRERLEHKLEEIGRQSGGEAATPDLDAGLDEPTEDDLLRLVFTACHPVLSAQARLAPASPSQTASAP